AGVRRSSERFLLLAVSPSLPLHSRRSVGVEDRQGINEDTARIVAKQRSLGRCHSIRRPSEHDDEKQESQAALGIAVQHMADARQDDGEAENEIWIVRLLRSLVYRHIALHSVTDCRIAMSRSMIAR